MAGWLSTMCRPGMSEAGRMIFSPRMRSISRQAQFDFFPYCGIQRPVWLVACPPEGLQDVIVQTELRADWTGARAD